jgi:hypothetical protein
MQLEKDMKVKRDNGIKWQLALNWKIAAYVSEWGDHEPGTTLSPVTSSRSRSEDLDLSGLRLSD